MSDVTKFDDPDQIVWDDPPEAKIGAGDAAKLDRFVSVLMENPLRSALFRQGGSNYYSLSDAQRRRYPHLRVENRRVEDGTVSTWMTYDPDYEPKKYAPRKSGDEGGEDTGTDFVETDEANDQDELTLD